MPTHAVGGEDVVISVTAGEALPDTEVALTIAAVNQVASSNALIASAEVTKRPTAELQAAARKVRNLLRATLTRIGTNLRTLRGQIQRRNLQTMLS